MKKAKEIFADYMDRYLSAADSSAKVLLCFSCTTRHYFRHDILPSYKGNRTGLPPIGLKKVKEWAAENYESRTKPNLEADDVLGILATHPKLIKGRKIIVSMDKDLEQIPGEHLAGARPEEGVYRISPEYGTRFMWQQVLQGDSTDNYAGLKGCGEVGAKRIVDCDLAEIEDRVLAAFHKANYSDEAIAQQINVARILTADTYNFTTKEPILWTSTKPSTNVATATETSPPTRKSRKTSKASS